MANIPTVFESIQGNERGYDIYSRLLKDRVVFVSGDIDEEMSNIIVAQLLFLDSSNSDVPIDMYINSFGGCISSGLAIYDTMQYIRPRTRTICVGSAMSMAAILLAAGHRRYALPSSTIMIHQGAGGFEGKNSDLQIQQKEMNRIENLCNEILSKHTGHTVKKLVRDQQKDKYMGAREALEYNMIDKILEKKR